MNTGITQNNTAPTNTFKHRSMRARCSQTRNICRAHHLPMDFRVWASCSPPFCPFCRQWSFGFIMETLVRAYHKGCLSFSSLARFCKTTDSAREWKLVSEHLFGLQLTEPTSHRFCKMLHSIPGGFSRASHEHQTVYPMDRSIV